MAKKRAPSIHSRAARRATSPSINTDKSLKNVKPPEESINLRPAVLAAHHNSGVTKKLKNGRKSVLSSKARRRQEKNQDRAEAVMERTSLKLQKSKTQARTIDGRRKAWDEINALVDDAFTSSASSKKKKSKVDGVDEEQKTVDKFFTDDGDEEMGQVDDEEAAEEPETPAPVPAPPPAHDDDDEIL